MTERTLSLLDEITSKNCVQRRGYWSTEENIYKDFSGFSTDRSCAKEIKEHNSPYESKRTTHREIARIS